MELRTEVVIDAPIDRVWQVLTDFAAYHEWNPFMTSIAGKLEVGQELNLVLSLPESGEVRVRAEVVRCDEPRELRWRAEWGFRALYAREHFFCLLPISETRTRVIHGENLGGWLLRFMGRRLTQMTRGFVYMNRALKKRIELNARLTDVA